VLFVVELSYRLIKEKDTNNVNLLKMFLVFFSSFLIESNEIKLTRKQKMTDDFVTKSFRITLLHRHKSREERQLREGEKKRTRKNENMKSIDSS
jgi:hypothetical protein